MCRVCHLFKFLNQVQHNFLSQCDLVLDAAHRKSTEPSTGPRKEDIVESIIFKASDVVVVTFKDVDLNFARKGTLVVFLFIYLILLRSAGCIYCSR